MAHVSRTFTPEPQSADEAELPAEFVTNVQDWRDIWEDIVAGVQTLPLRL
jgi:hypothetical protein